MNQKGISVSSQPKYGNNVYGHECVEHHPPNTDYSIGSAANLRDKCWRGLFNSIASFHKSGTIIRVEPKYSITMVIVLFQLILLLLLFKIIRVGKFPD